MPGLRRLAAAAASHPGAFVGYLLYFWTCAPGIGASDAALLIDEMRNLSFSTHANHHNLTIVLGWLASFIPLGSPARQANLLQALLGGTAVALFYFLVLRTFGGRRVAILATLGVTVLHSLWWHSTIAEVYAANAVFTVLALILVTRLRDERSDRLLPALFFLAAIALFNHVQMGFVAVGAAVYLVLRMHDLWRGHGTRSALRLTGRCAAAFAVGFVPYAVVFARDVRRLEGFRPALAQALGGDFRKLMFRGSLPEAGADLAFLFLWQFSSPFLLAAMFGIRRLSMAFAGSPSLAALGAMFALNTGFFAFYPTWDKYAFLLPSFLMLAFAAAHALDALERRPAKLGTPAAVALAFSFVLPPPLLYARLPSLSGLGGPFARFANPDGSNGLGQGRYLADPDKRGFHDYEEFAAALLARLPSGAVYVDDDSRSYYSIRYLQKYEGARSDFRLELVNAWGFDNWGLSKEGFVQLVEAARYRRLPLYLASLETPYLALLTSVPEIDDYRFRRFPLDGRRSVYRLVPRVEESELGPPEAPRSAVLAVGEALGSPRARPRRNFGASDTVTAELRFERNGEPFTLWLRWEDPGGRQLASGPIRVPFGCVSAWGTLEAARPLAAGLWKVRAESNGVSLGATDFRVRGAAPLSSS